MLLIPGERRFYSLDDFDVADLAQRDSDALLGGPKPVTIDEVQRQRRLLSAGKRAIDRKRRAGQLLRAGSANLLLMRQVSESLAGRASYLTRWPMTRREQHGLGRCGLWEELLATHESSWIDVLRDDLRHAEDWRALARRGGFPTPAIQMKTEGERTI
jgi:predicted AAA+ superfamily ATPase